MKIRKEDERMMKKRIKTGGALILAAVLAISAFVIPKAFAADGVNVTKDDCTLTIDLTAESLFKEVREKEVTVDLYKVATIKVTGEYEVVTPYTDIKDFDLSDLSSNAAANEWEAKANAVRTYIDEATDKPTPITEKGIGTIQFTGLETGMYLVYARTLVTDNYEYEFKPYLISVPTNEWDWTKEDKTDMSDEWIYDPVVSLKPERFDRYGDLVINKDLTSFNDTIGGATFVFEVKAEKTDVDTNVTNVVYNDVVSMTFEGPGSKAVIIKNIEAGAKVTVTEVYSGASYELTVDSNEKAETIILADNEVSVGFKNENNGGLNGGNGVVNTFTQNGTGFSHKATDDSTGSVIIAKTIEE